jgi:hypothetical protein
MRLDVDRNVFKVQRAGFLARSGADAAGELRKVVGRVQVAERDVPVALKDQIIPVRDLVVDRTPVGPWQNGMPQSMQRAAWLATS